MARKKAKQHFVLDSLDDKQLSLVYGTNGENMSLLEAMLGIEIANDKQHFTVMGLPKSIAAAETIIRDLHALSMNNISVSKEMVREKVEAHQTESSPTHKPAFFTASLRVGDKTITPRTPNQQHYVECLNQYDINFGVGPSGTGKTFLAVASALAAYDAGHVNRIILCRPAVEAGEKLGFLPGDINEKITPYLQPLYDALYNLYGVAKVDSLIRNGVLEVQPLAYMRGRTLSDSYVILDEAQNATTQQMKMFLTRMGFQSKLVITGDVTQTDLPSRQDSGLRHAMHLLQDIDGIEFTFFKANDIVRHPLVQLIIEAYEQTETDHDRSSSNRN